MLRLLEPLILYFDSREKLTLILKAGLGKRIKGAITVNFSLFTQDEGGQERFFRINSNYISRIRTKNVSRIKRLSRRRSSRKNRSSEISRSGCSSYNSRSRNMCEYTWL